MAEVLIMWSEKKVSLGVPINASSDSPGTTVKSEREIKAQF
jgi:hypothetical protein